MIFTSAQLDTILRTTGEPVTIQLSGVTVATVQGKFRKDYEDISGYETSTGILKPAVLVKTSDMAGITSAHTFVVQGTEYKFDGKPHERADGFTLVKLGLKL